MSEPPSAVKDRVPCYAENPHGAHDWTFADDYPLMRCPGVSVRDYDEAMTRRDWA